MSIDHNEILEVLSNAGYTSSQIRGMSEERKLKLVKGLQRKPTEVVETRNSIIYKGQHGTIKFDKNW